MIGRMMMIQLLWILTLQAHDRGGEQRQAAHQPPAELDAVDVRLDEPLSRQVDDVHGEERQALRPHELPDQRPNPFHNPDDDDNFIRAC
jgi:hypothetical protein